jgi:PIN domain
MDTATALHHVFVDFENVPEIDFEVLGNDAVHITLLLGVTQKKLDADLVEQLLRHAGSTELVRLQSPGRNALDFVLAYHLGRAVEADPEGRFHIVSKDTGFEPLITHLRSKEIRASRHADFAALKAELPPASAGGPAAGVIGRVIARLRKAAASRPKNKKALAHFLRTALGERFSAAEIKSLIRTLQEQGHLEFNAHGLVIYQLGDEPQYEAFSPQQSNGADHDDDIPF